MSMIISKRAADESIVISINCVFLQPVIKIIKYSTLFYEKQKWHKVTSILKEILRFFLEIYKIY